ncbi:MAG: carbohydrate kinase [Treponema sp.]|nr:carbohydrate kinase [Treponema sp.]
MILGCGEALIDMVPKTTKLPGAENEETLYLPCLGGSPFNTAIAAVRQNVPVGFLGRFSRDFFGESLVGHLTGNGVSPDFIIRTGEHTTLAFVKLDAGGKAQYVFYTEGSADRSLEIADLPAKLPDDVRCIFFGSIAMTMEPVASTIEHFIKSEAERPNGPVISLDPNIRPFMIPDPAAFTTRFELWLSRTGILKISEEDFDFIYPGLGLEKSLARSLEKGPTLAVSTLGAKGVLGWLKKKDGSVLKVSAPVVEVPIVDTIGAGDTFHGAFLAWLERKGRMSRAGIESLSEAELYDALFFANKAASLVCSRQGANPPTLAETEALK